MSIVNRIDVPVKLEDLAEDLEVADDGRPGPIPATMETSEWIEAQASYYRSLGSDLADLVADSIAGLARDWRVASAGRPIGVETFRARMEVMAEFQAELEPA
jgi:hypothetical protein